jgi:hypothetical protein
MVAMDENTSKDERELISVRVIPWVKEALKVCGQQEHRKLSEQCAWILEQWLLERGERAPTGE